MPIGSAPRAFLQSRLFHLADSERIMSPRTLPVLDGPFPRGFRRNANSPLQVSQFGKETDPMTAGTSMNIMILSQPFAIYILHVCDCISVGETLKGS